MEFADNETTDVKPSGGGKGSQFGNGASPGKIFVGGLSRETTTAQFLEHFGAYGEITDNVIIKDRNSGLPRGFGFITYADPNVVDQVMEDTHVINGKQVEIKRTIPKGSGGDGEFKTKKIFVGGIPTTVTEDELREFFSKFGEVKEHQILKDPITGRARGFGFVVFDSEKPVDDILARGNKLDMDGAQVEVKKAEPKKPNPPPPKSRSTSRPAYDGGAYGGAYERGAARYGYEPGAGPYRSSGAYGARASPYGGYGRSEVGGGYSSGVGGPYRGGPSLDYPSPYSRGGGGFGRGHDMGGSYAPSYGGYGGSGVGGGYGGGGVGGGYGGGAVGGGYGGGGVGGGYGGGGGYGVGGGYGGAGYESSMGGGYGGASAGRGRGYGSPGSYPGGAGRYHPYGR